MDKYIGRLLDNRYEILEVIGTGGMAVVYKARCHRLNRLVAIKILKDDFMEDEEFRRRFHSESQAVAMFSHPNIVSVYDVSTSITADYIVMELIDGITLKQYMEKKGVLNWKETLHFAIQIAKALEHAHSRGIVHRDIKPHNVMVLKNGSVKVTDFGIARMMSKGHTLTREALGSVHYISPEQAKGGRVDNRSDIYSLGVVMYEMMSGRPPYDGESPVAVAIQHINGGAKMPSTLNPNIPGGMEQIIMKAMAHEPDGRYATATAMLTDLDEFRKNPSILFDYNTPPTDAVVNIPKGPLVLEPQTPKTTAQRMENRANNQNRRTPERRTPNTGATPERRTPANGASAQELQRRREERQQAARRRQEAEAEQRRNRITTIAVIACSLAMVVAVVFFLIVLLKDDVAENTIPVPKLIGNIYEDVKDSAELKDFTVDVTYEYNDHHAEGMVISQSPKAGEEVTAGTKIKIVVSKGAQAKPEYMPDVVGSTKEEAKNILKDVPLNLDVIAVDEFNETIEAGIVIRTDPAETAELTENQKIILYVSAGKEIKKDTMPKVTEEDEETAKLILNNKELDLDIQVEKEFSNDVKAGLVVRSEPAEGDSLQTGQTVILYLSDGPETREIPTGILGTAERDAQMILVQTGFTVEVKESEETYKDKEAGTIVEIFEITEEGSEARKEGDKVQLRNTIVLVYAKAPTGTMPAVAGKTEEEVRAALNDLDLKLEIKTEKQFHTEIKKGSVISSDPQEGAPLQVGQTVTLYISDGPEMKKLPTGILGMSENAAKVLLLEADFTVKAVVSEELWKDCEPGTVAEIRVDDKAVKEGDPVDISKTVLLIIAREPEPETKTVKIPVTLPEPPKEETTQEETPSEPTTEEPENTPEPTPEPKAFDVTIEVTRDGKKVAGKLSEDKKFYVLENQSGIGDVTYVVIIKVNGQQHQKFDHIERFNAQ